MRMIWTLLGGALLAIGLVLILAGLFAAMPAGPDARYSAAQQMEWSLGRGINAMMLGLGMWAPALLALILARLTPDPTQDIPPAQWQAALLRIDKALAEKRLS